VVCVDDRSTKWRTACRRYWIAHINVTNPEGYKGYLAANAEPIGRFGGRFLVRAGKHETRAGPEHQRHVVVEFPSFEAAKACYDSAEYQAAAKIRDANAEVQLVIVEGCAG
jgi:uncharacterized protein (DUF1330 family)